MEKVSIIVPVYNAYSSIDKCIESIINQTYKNIELILINDGSKDDSITKIKAYEKKYKNIRVIDKKNEGVSKTRNLGIREATGKYIMFIDNDDYIDNDYVETLLTEIIATKADCIFSGYRRENSKGKVIKIKKLKNKPWSKYILSAPWAKIYNREFLLKNKIEFLPYKIGEDVYFTIKLINCNAKIEIIDYIGYTWYFNDVSVSNTIQRGMKKEVDILFLLDKINSFSNKDKYTCYFFYKYCVWYLLFSGRQASKKQFVEEHKKYKEWLIKNDYYKTISPFSFKLNGESVRDRLCVFTFKVLDKLHLIKLFATIYCRGDNNE